MRKIYPHEIFGSQRKLWRHLLAGMAMLCFLLLVGKRQAIAQEIEEVTGIARDASSNDPLIGVSILEGSGKNLKPVGITDNAGKFKVSAKLNSVLTFRYVGYSDYELKVRSGRRLITVHMSVVENKLKEAVIIGYQAKTRELTTGSAVNISGKTLQDVPVSNVEELLQGRVAGLNIQNNTGAPGGRGTVAIRGLSNITVKGNGSDAFLSPTSPLYVIDGVPIDPDANFSYGFQSAGPGVSPLSLIPPEDIESMEILKDAEATALYGSRGAYGVIIITTKRGSSPIPLVRYTANFFVNTPPKLRTTLGGTLERRLRVDQILKNGTYNDIFQISTTPFLADSLNPYYDNSTNWQGIFYQTTYNETHNVEISGGSPQLNYKADLGYYHENGVIHNTGFDRYSIGTNMQYQPTPRLRVFGTISTQIGKRKLGSGNGLLQTGVATGGQASSLLPGPSFFQSTSGILAALQTQNNNRTLNLSSSLDVTYQILQGLTLGTTISYSYGSNTQDRFIPALAHNDYSQIYAYDDRNYTLYNRNSISYFYSLNKKHNFLVTAFNEFYNKGFQAQAIQQEKTPNDQYQGPLGYDPYYTLGGGLLDNYNRLHTVSFAGLFSYNYLEKYVLNASYRLDGTSSSGFQNPYAKNPSLGIRWNFNKENLLKDSKWLTYGSLRGSWGQNIVPSGDIFSIYGAYIPRGTYDGNTRIGSDFTQLPNPDLKPTTTTQYDAGFEGGFFNDRIEVIFDAYYKIVKNLLRTKPLADITGYGQMVSDETSVVDYGYELTLTFHPLPQTSSFQWTISLNGALNKDVLIHLPNDARQLIQFDSSSYHQNILYRVGRNSLTNYLLQTEGVYKSTADVPVDPATGLRYRTSNGTFFQGGDPVWKDVDHNYILDNNDYVAAGNSQPLITGGLQSYLNYKNFSLNITCSYTAIRAILNNALADRLLYLDDPFGNASGGPKAIVDFNSMDVWTHPGQRAKYPNPFDFEHAASINSFRADQTLFQEDGSYFKINTVTLAYLVDKSFTDRLGINAIRFYISCNNLKTFSGYNGPNPENVTALGRDQSNGYPIPRTWNFGLNVEF